MNNVVQLLLKAKMNKFVQRHHERVDPRSSI